MFAPYRLLITCPGVPRLLVIEFTTKLSTPVLSLALLLASVESFGSYAAAGLVLTAHALTLALCAPIGGRLADRHGARRVLTGYLVAHTGAYVLLLLVQGSSPPVVIGAAALLGASVPPTGSVIRSGWPRLVPAASVPTAYALDSAINELMFIVGPVLVSVLLLALPAQTIVAGAGASLLVGTALLMTSPAVTRDASAKAPRSSSGLARFLGPLSHRPTLILLIVAASGTFSFGCLRIGTVAFSTEFSGVLMGLLSVGGLVGTLAYGSRVWPGSGLRLLVLLSLADAASMLAGGFAPGLLTLGGLITLTGLITGPRDALQHVLLAEEAPAHQRTEVFAWLNSFMWGGYGLGTAIAGALTGPGDDGRVAYLTAAAVVLAGALLAAALQASRPGRLTLPAAR